MFYAGVIVPWKFFRDSVMNLKESFANSLRNTSKS